MKKKFLYLCMAMVFVTQVAAISTSAMPLFYAASGRRGVYVYVEASTTPNVKTTSTAYGLKKGKYVKSVRIRLREGSYSTSKSTSSGYVSISRLNNPLQTAYGTWSWTYK